MKATAAKPARSEPEPGLDDEVRIARLRAANINPHTGLATDYLNHFNEAIMLLEMIPDIPESVEDFLRWRPLSYAEHFTASHFKARDSPSPPTVPPTFTSAPSSTASPAR